MIKRVNISLSEAGRRVFAAAPRLVGITLMVMRLFRPVGLRDGVCPKKRIRLTWAGALVGLILIIKSRRLLYLVDGFLDALEY